MKEPIVQSGDPVLRAKAKPVALKDIGSKKISGVIARMKKALAAEDFGVAIAAPQIGESLRIFVIAGKAFEPERDSADVNAASGQGEREQNPAPDHQVKDKVFINPEILRMSKKTKEMSEGCLSVRGKYGTVMRHEKAAVKAVDENGKPFTYQGSGLIGHIFQHECDHLEGILYIDKTVKLEEDEDLKGARKKVREKHGL
jgi:peptide deformylase